VAFGIAVSGMHYTAMAGMTTFPMAMSLSGAPALSTDLLAIVVGVVAFCVSGIFLLVLVPDRSQEQRLAQGTAVYPDVPAAPAFASGGIGNQAQFGRGTYAPLGGAGGPPPRIARHLPVERDGATHFIAVEDVVAVHANAHYTYVFNGTLKLFCPLAIGEVESRLDKNRFIRVHRSHIINIDRVVGHRRNGDGELVEMAASDHYPVPVSRSRASWLKSRIGAKPG
jgi:DNA-binding LytR/AlgR family response regulator